MKTLSSLLLIASLVLLGTLWLNEKEVFETDQLHNICIIKLINSFLKTIIVLFAYIVGFFALLFIALIDIFSSIIWKVEFPILHLVYENFFIGFSKSWYWDQHTGIYLFLSGVVIFLICAVVLGIPDLRRHKRVVYHPQIFTTRIF